MLEYCLGLDWGAMAVGLVHELIRSNFLTIDSSMQWLEPGCYSADRCISSSSILSLYVLERTYVGVQSWSWLGCYGGWFGP
jgi:hypothetical protein